MLGETKFEGAITTVCFEAEPLPLLRPVQKCQIVSKSPSSFLLEKWMGKGRRGVGKGGGGEEGEGRRGRGSRELDVAGAEAELHPSRDAGPEACRCGDDHSQAHTLLHE